MPIDQLFSSLHQHETQQNGNLAVLEMLTVLPEEVVEDRNWDCNISTEKRSQFTRELLSHTPTQAPALIATATAEALTLADALLNCVTYSSSDWEIADSTLQFWCCLANYLLGVDFQNANRKTVEDMFFPVFSALLDAVLLRAQVGDTGLDNRDSLDIPDGNHFRLNLEELLIDICQILGPAAFVQKLLSIRCASFDSFAHWVELEARMFALNVESNMFWK